MLLRQNMKIADCTIDLLSTIVEEINIHNIPYSAFREYFNHKPQKVVYERYIYNETTSEFKWEDMLRLRDEVTPDTKQIEYIDISVIKVDGEDIYYKTQKYNAKAKKYADVIYKIRKSTTGTTEMYKGKAIPTF